MDSKPKLIIINGTTGVGKSTIACRIHEKIPMSFLLEMDAIRRYFSGYSDMRKESLAANYELCKAMCEQLLKAGHSVILEKVIPDNDTFLDDLYEIGNTHGADTCEIILHAPKETIIERAATRGYREGGSLTPEKVVAFWEGIEKLIPRRPRAMVIDTSNKNIDETCKQVLQSIF